MLAVISACTSVPEEGPTVRRGDSLGKLIDRAAEPEPASKPLEPGQDAASFVGRDIQMLEAVVGMAALIRREGPNEFRRYDLEGCRVYAIVAGGLVQTLTTGPLATGETAPTLPACTAGM